MNSFKPGLYRHYKGGLYTALGLITHHESRQPMVHYVSLTYGGANVRPLHPNTVPGDPSGWFDPIGPDGPSRFEYVGDLPSDTPAAERKTT